MSKYLSILVLSLAAVSGVHAGVEINSYMNGSTYTIETINTETQEVIDVQRFQFNGDGTFVQLATDVDLVAEEAHQALEDAATSAVPDGLGISTDSDLISDDSVSDTSTNTKVSIWNVFKQKLDASKEYLSGVLETVQDKVSSLQGGGDETVALPAEEGEDEAPSMVETPEVKQ